MKGTAGSAARPGNADDGSTGGPTGRDRQIWPMQLRCLFRWLRTAPETARLVLSIQVLYATIRRA